jgi:hypothetical protein
MAIDSAAFEEELDGWDMVRCADEDEMRERLARDLDISGETTTRCESIRQARDCNLIPPSMLPPQPLTRALELSQLFSISLSTS